MDDKLRSRSCKLCMAFIIGILLGYCICQLILKKNSPKEISKEKECNCGS